MSEYRLSITIEKFGDEESDYKEIIQMYKQKLPYRVIASILRQMADELDPAAPATPKYYQTWTQPPIYGTTSGGSITYTAKDDDDD